MQIRGKAQDSFCGDLVPWTGCPQARLSALGRDFENLHAFTLLSSLPLSALGRDFENLHAFTLISSLPAALTVLVFLIKESSVRNEGTECGYQGDILEDRKAGGIL